MSLKRALIQQLDRPGGRAVLGRLATLAARRQLKTDVEIFYAKGLWTHRIGPYYFPDGPVFEYYEGNLEPWPGQAKEYFSISDEFWFRHYRPIAGNVIIDVGAGRGEDTLVFSQAVGPTGRVYSIEAHPDSFRILKQMVRLNHLINARPLQLAVMDKPGQVSMVEGSSWQGNAVVAAGTGSTVEVAGAPLDDICDREKIDAIDFVKMNIEGAERQAVAGMRRCAARIKSVCISCHDFRADTGGGDHFRTRAFVQEVLAQYGFRVITYPDDPRPPVRDLVYGIRVA